MTSVCSKGFKALDLTVNAQTCSLPYMETFISGLKEANPQRTNNLNV
jgi:hypothetical protein